MKNQCISASSKIEKVPRGIRGEKSSKDMASSRNLVSTVGAQVRKYSILIICPVLKYLSLSRLCSQRYMVFHLDKGIIVATFEDRMLILWSCFLGLGKVFAD